MCGLLQLEDVAMTIVLPRHVTNCALTPSQGRYTFDIATKTLSWDIGKIDTSRLPNIRGSVCSYVLYAAHDHDACVMQIVSGVSAVSAASALPPALDTSSPTINVSFKINQLAVSGLKVNRLDMFGEQYKPFKGVKYISKAGRFQVRT
jgi:AP-3 complex subunit mu